MPDPAAPVLDTNVLQAFGFGHAQGFDVLLRGLGVPVARVPREVYDQDEGEATTHDDELLSEFARGIRYARRRARSGRADEAGRFRRWLENIRALPRHIERKSLTIDALTLEELAVREHIMAEFGVGRGEAACLALVQRDARSTVLVSSDEDVVVPAKGLGMRYTTIPEVLCGWAAKVRPSFALVDEVLEGMENARFALAVDDRRAVLEAAGLR